MFYSLKGVITHVADDFVVMEVCGVGYQVFTDARTLSQLAVGEATELFTYTHVREDALQLFGMPDLSARQMFETLLKVNGVGAKMALAIQSILTAEEIIGAIQIQDPTPFTRASGVGKKLAERIVLELKGKMGSVAISGAGANGAAVQQSGNQMAGDVISALINLGYKPAQAQKAVQTILTDDPDIAFEPLFKASLQELR